MQEVRNLNAQLVLCCFLPYVVVLLLQQQQQQLSSSSSFPSLFVFGLIQPPQPLVVIRKTSTTTLKQYHHVCSFDDSQQRRQSTLWQQQQQQGRQQSWSRTSTVVGTTTSALCMSSSSTSTGTGGGYGLATNYSWTETAYELDVTFYHLPLTTRTVDVTFQPKSNSIDLRVKGKLGQPDLILMNHNRILRGRINLDGTYWVLSDPDRITTTSPLSSSATAAAGGGGDPGQKYRSLTLTIEKLIRTPRDDFDVIDYDWKGLYTNEMKNEVLERKYVQPEELNVREYAANLGVDIDNINMSYVDKNMFRGTATTTTNPSTGTAATSHGLNISESMIRQLNEAGYITKDITEQQEQYQQQSNNNNIQENESDQWTNEDDNKEEKDDNIGTTSKLVGKKKVIPLIDTNSPWNQVVVPNEVLLDRMNNTTTTTTTKNDNVPYVQQVRNFTRAAFAVDRVAQNNVRTKFMEMEEGEEEDNDTDDNKMDERIDDNSPKRTVQKKNNKSSTGTTSKTRSMKSTSSSSTKTIKATDPIDLLTVQRLKEILKSQGLSGTGTKQELQNRLRQQVNSLLQGGNGNIEGGI